MRDAGSPAHAGIDPAGSYRRASAGWFPRPRGDRPDSIGRRTGLTGVSPPTENAFMEQLPQRGSVPQVGVFHTPPFVQRPHSSPWFIARLSMRAPVSPRESRRSCRSQAALRPTAALPRPVRHLAGAVGEFLSACAHRRCSSVLAAPASTSRAPGPPPVSSPASLRKLVTAIQSLPLHPDVVAPRENPHKGGAVSQRLHAGGGHRSMMLNSPSYSQPVLGMNPLVQG